MCDSYDKKKIINPHFIFFNDKGAKDIRNYKTNLKQETRQNPIKIEGKNYSGNKQNKINNYDRFSNLMNHPNLLNSKIDLNLKETNIISDSGTSRLFDERAIQNQMQHSPLNIMNKGANKLIKFDKRLDLKIIKHNEISIINNYKSPFSTFKKIVKL